jgi:V-type H+-transporting ATPase subunit E
MTAFIRQEALEKAKEIQIKADEEFAIEKSKLVRQETSTIDSTYAKKFKQASMSQQITRSTLANKTRIKVLSARQELLDELFEKARDQLAGYAKDKAKYESMCKGLILEGLYAMNEDQVAVRARKADYDVMKKAIEGAKKEYKKNLGKDIEIELDEKNPQPQDSYVPYFIWTWDHLEVGNAC